MIEMRGRIPTKPKKVMLLAKADLAICQLCARLVKARFLCSDVCDCVGVRDVGLYTLEEITDDPSMSLL